MDSVTGDGGDTGRGRTRARRLRPWPEGDRPAAAPDRTPAEPDHGPPRYPRGGLRRATGGHGGTGRRSQDPGDQAVPPGDRRRPPRGEGRGRGIGQASPRGLTNGQRLRIHSSVVVTVAWRGKTFSVSTRWTSGSRSAQASESTVSR